MATYVGSTGKQNFDGTTATSIATDAYALTAGNLAIVVLRTGGSIAAGSASVTDTAGNTYRYDGTASGGRFHVWSKANCLGHAANIVTVTHPSAAFTAVTLIEFSDVPTGMSCAFSSNNVASGTSVSLSPSSGFASQVSVICGDVSTSELPTLAGASLTVIYSSGPTGNGPFVGLGSHRVSYNINTAGTFNGAVAVTASGAATTFERSLVAAIYGPGTVPTTPDPGMDNSVPCCGTATPGGSHAGPLLPAVDPAWTSVCTGGGDLYDAATDPTDPESWDDPSERTADTWLELRLEKYPASEGTLVLRYAKRPFADDGSFKEGRLESLSKSRRACTDPDGNYDIGKVTAVLADGDGYIRSLLDKGEATEYFANREASIYTATETTRKAGNQRLRFRGWISNVKLLPNRRVQIDITDVVGSQFSGFNLDRQIGVPITANEHPNAPPETLKKIYPIIGGERSDLDAVDENGDSAEKGIEPAIDCGDYDISGEEQEPSFVSPPINFSVTVVGTPGSKTQTYAVTAITPLGETLPCEPITINNAPDVRDAVDYVRLTWDPADAFSEANTIAYRILGRSTDPPTAWLDGMNNGGTWVNPETEYHDDHDQDVEKSLPELGTTTGAADDFTFAWMCVSIGYGYELLDVFGSDVADGGEPKRAKFDSNQFGKTIIRPQDPEWPHADPYVEFGGIRQFGFYARGNPLKHHRNGSCTLAVTICGPHDDDELVLNQPGTLQLWFLNEHVLKNGGTGYRSGDWGPLETYANGNTILNKTQFDAAQDVTIDWLGGLGYLMDLSIHEPITLREILRRWTLSFGWRYASDHWGRIRPVVINDLASSTDGRHLRDRIEITRNEDDDLAWDEVLNRIDYEYHLDADSGQNRATGRFAEHGISIAAHTPGAEDGSTERRTVKQQTRDLWGINDLATALDTQQRELTRRRRRPRYVKDAVDLMALDYEIGDQFRRTHYNGLGASGDEATPMLAIAYEEDYDRNEITIEMQDLRGILADTDDEDEIVYSSPFGLDVIYSSDTGETVYASEA